MKKGLNTILNKSLLVVLLSALLAPVASQAQVNQEKYLSYDNWGNPTEVQDALGVKTAYTWSQDGTKIVGIFTNAEPSGVFAHSFAYDGLIGWTFMDNGSDGDTQASISGGKLKLKNYASAVNGEFDRIHYNHGAEVTQSVIWEFDVLIANSNSWDLQMNAGGSSWNTSSGSTERAVWSAINNESWRTHNGSSWVTLKSGLTVGKTYQFKIVMHPGSNSADYYLNGEQLATGIPFRNSSSGIQKVAFGNYGYSSVTTEWLIDNVRMYPEEAQAISQEVDPLFGNSVALKDAAGSTNRFSYDDFGRLEESYNANGELVSSQVYYYSLDGNASFNPADPNRVESWTHNDPSTPSDVTKSVSYLDGLGREIQTHQRGGSSTLITGMLYDERGRLEVTSRPIEKANQTTYLSTLFDGSGTFTPGSALPGSSPIEDYYQESYAYSQKAYESSPLGRTVKRTLPGSAHKMGNGHEVFTNYELNTDTTETFTINGYTWPRNRLLKIITKDPDTNQTITYTDGWGQVIASGVDMDRNGKLDGKNKATCSVDNCDLITEFSYDLRGNLIRVEDPRGLITTYTYDERGLLTQKQLPDQTKSHTYRYDDKGRLRFTRDPKMNTSGQLYYTKYDNLDRPTEIGKYNSTATFFNDTTSINDQTFPGVGTSPYIKYAYDGDSTYTGARNLKGRLTHTSYKDLDTGGWGSSSYSYNEIGLVEWVVQRLPGLAGDHKIEYSYDELGRTTRMFYNPPGTGDDYYTWYYYDDLGRLEEVASHATPSEGNAQTEAVYTYGADGQPTQLVLGGGAQTVDYLYTVQGWMNKINNRSSMGSDRFAMDLGYKYNGNISTQYWLQAGISSSVSNTSVYTYYYDNANRIDTANFSGAGYTSTAFDVIYSYDKNGNLEDIYRNRNSSTVDHYNPVFIDSTNIIDYVSFGGTKQFSNDANGNITVNGIQGITSTSYDWRNLPYSVTASSTMKYAYDADGNRVRKERVGGTEMHYVRGASGETVAVYQNGSRAFVNLLAGSEIIGTFDGNQRRYFLKDHLGSIRTTVDASGNVDGYDDYYPFGLAMPGRSVNSANPNDSYKFTGYELDNEANLILYHADARGYDPVIGRFMQIDPMSHLYPGISPFAYAMNNPLVYIDPTGETVECTTEESCQQAADDINKTHEGAGVGVVEKERTVTTGFLWWKKEETETYYELTTGNEDFDWSQDGTDEFGAAVYEILASEDVVMNVVYTTGNIPYSSYETNRSPISGPGGYGGGFFDRGDFAPASDGGTVYVDPRGYNGEPSAVILMHEMLGHGHSVGGVLSTNASQNALRVNNHYLKKLGLPKRRGGGHGGFGGSPRFNK